MFIRRGIWWYGYSFKLHNSISWQEVHFGHLRGDVIVKSWFMLGLERDSGIKEFILFNSSDHPLNMHSQTSNGLHLRNLCPWQWTVQDTRSSTKKPLSTMRTMWGVKNDVFPDWWNTSLSLMEPSKSAPTMSWSSLCSIVQFKILIFNGVCFCVSLCLLCVCVCVLAVGLVKGLSVVVLVA